MLTGEAVIAIWNDVVPAGRPAFHDWHLHELFPGMLAVPGFSRARRYVAVDAATQPEFFTCFEMTSIPHVSDGASPTWWDAPTPWGEAMHEQLRNTTRAVADLVESSGAGVGGVLLTLQFAGLDDARESLIEVVRAAGRGPRITGAHLCHEACPTPGDRPPGWLVMLEATDAAALADVLADDDLREAGADDWPRRGLYRLEHLHP